MNPMVSQIMGQQAEDNPLLQAWKMAQACQNPKEALMNALAKSGNSGKIMSLLQQNNWDGQKTFFEYAKEQGIDGNQLVQQLRSMGLK